MYKLLLQYLRQQMMYYVAARKKSRSKETFCYVNVLFLRQTFCCVSFNTRLLCKYITDAFLLSTKHYFIVGVTLLHTQRKIKLQK